MTHPDQLTHNGYGLWWVDEHSEVIVARTEQEAREFYGAKEHAESGPVTWDCDVTDEDGPTMPLSEVLIETVETWVPIPAQISTQYT